MLYRQGIDRQAVLLPDGEKLDRITIRGPAPSVDMPAGVLLAWCREHFPAAVEEYIDPAAIDTADVIAAVRDKLPDVIRYRVRPATAKVLIKEIEESGGYLTDRRTGDPTPKIAEVSEGAATGAFSFTANNAAARRERLMAELTAGWPRDLIGFGPVALPAAEPEPDEPHAADLSAWKAWQAAGHAAKGCEGWSQGFVDGVVTCACGEVVPVPEKAATG